MYITKKHGKGSNEENSFHGGSYLRFGFYKKYIWLLYAEKRLTINGNYFCAEYIKFFR